MKLVRVSWVFLCRFAQKHGSHEGWLVCGQLMWPETFWVITQLQLLVSLLLQWSTCFVCYRTMFYFFHVQSSNGWRRKPDLWADDAFCRACFEMGYKRPGVLLFCGFDSGTYIVFPVSDPVLPAGHVFAERVGKSQRDRETKTRDCLGCWDGDGSWSTCLQCAPTCELHVVVTCLYREIAAWCCYHLSTLVLL